MAGRVITIDDVAADGGKEKTQSGHIRWHNANGRIMIDATDVYNGRYSVNGLKNFKGDCRESIVILAGRIFYNRGNSSGRIVHHYGSKAINPASVRVEIPVLGGECITDVVSAPTGLKYVRAYLDTGDGTKRIIKRLEKISGLDADKIIIWTPDQSDRRDYPSRASGLYCINGDFHVYGYGNLSSDGRSRGVQYMPAEQAAHEAYEPEKELRRLVREHVPKDARNPFYRELRRLKR